MLNQIWKTSLRLGLLTLLSMGFSVGLIPAIDRTASVSAQEETNSTVDDRKVEADRLLQQGIELYNRSQFRAALQAWETALELYRTIDDVQGEVRSLGSLGNAYFSLDEYRTAIDFYQQSLELSRAIDDVPGESSSLMGLGLAYSSLGEYRTAIDFYQQSLELSRAIDDVWREAASLTNLGIAYDFLGEYRTAIDFYQQSLELFRAIDDVRREAASLNNLGIAYFSLGEYRTALDYHQQSLEIKRAIDDVQGEANSLNNLGLAYRSLGEYRTAIDYHQQSLEIFRTIDDVQGEAASLSSLGNAYAFLGEHRRAIDFYQQSLEIFRAIDDVQGEAGSLSNLGLVYLSLGEYRTTIDFYEQGLAIFQQIEDVESEGLALSNLGIVYQEQGQDDLAITFFKASVNVREGIRAGIQELPQNLQQSYTETISDTYRRLADLLIQQGRISEALQVLELLKAAEIQEYTRGEILTPGARDVDLYPEEAAIIETHSSLIALGRTITECEASGSCADLPNYYTRRTALTARYNDITATFSQELDDRFASGDRPPDPASLLGEDVRRIIDSQPNTVLIYPVVLDNEIWILWASDGGIADPIRVPIPEAEVNQAVFQFQDLMRQCEYVACTEADLPQVQAVAQKLYSWLIPAQLEDELRANGIENLVFALDRTVRYIPMAALFDGNQYLIENYTVSTVTAAWLTPESTLTGSEISVMALGLSESVPANPEENLPGFGSLDNVPIELAAIVQSPESRSATGIYPGVSLLNDRFDETAFYQLQGHQILHIATHGLYVPTALDSSFLVLGNKQTWRISQIKNLTQFFTDLRLVVLSACETALGGRELNDQGHPDLDGREISGIAQSFMDAGADTVVASLWQVSDRSTSVLMQEFYQSLAQTETPLTIAQSMRQTQLMLLQQGEVDVTAGTRGANGTIEFVPNPDTPIADQLQPTYAHPYFWAPFVVIGNGLESLSGE